MHKYFVGILIVTVLISCRAVEHYLYRKVCMPLFEGELQIEVRARPKDYDVGGKRLTRYASPYSLDFRFLTGINEKLFKIRIGNVTLEGQETGKVIDLLPREKVYKDYKQPYQDSEKKSIFILLGYSDEARDWPYQPYILRAVVQVYRDDVHIDEEWIEVLLQPDFKESRRSDTFDSIMSI